MIKMRLHGTLEEIKKMTNDLSKHYKILSESEPYKDRGKSVYYRIYLDVEMKMKEGK